MFWSKWKRFQQRNRETSLGGKHILLLLLLSIIYIKWKFILFSSVLSDIVCLAAAEKKIAAGARFQNKSLFKGWHFTQAQRNINYIIIYNIQGYQKLFFGDSLHSRCSFTWSSGDTGTTWIIWTKRRPRRRGPLHCWPHRPDWKARTSGCYRRARRTRNTRWCFILNMWCPSGKHPGPSDVCLWSLKRIKTRN